MDILVLSILAGMIVASGLYMASRPTHDPGKDKPDADD